MFVQKFDSSKSKSISAHTITAIFNWSRRHLLYGCQVLRDGFRSWSIEEHAAIVEQDRFGAKSLNRRHIVANEQHRSTASCGFFHLAQTLLLKSRISYCQYFVDNKDLWIQMCCDCKG
jgi:hypothetical protein